MEVDTGFRNGLEIAGEQAVAEWEDRRQAGAVFSDDRRYRYRLWRKWDPSRPVCLFIMLNPSTADETRPDPTVARCVGFAQKWGYGSLEVGNLFAYKSTDPSYLYAVPDPIGLSNDETLRAMISEASMVVCAWGTKGEHMGRDREVLTMIPSPFCLGTTSHGFPIHPLYVDGNRKPIPYKVKEDLP